MLIALSNRITRQEYLLSALGVPGVTGTVLSCWRWMCQFGSVFQATDNLRVFVSDCIDASDKIYTFYCLEIFKYLRTVMSSF